MKGGVFYYTQISHIGGGGEGRVTKKSSGKDLSVNYPTSGSAVS